MANSVTWLLDAWRRGDAGAADELFALIYDDLRALARRQIGRVDPGQTLAPTVLVHEVYMKFAERSAPNAVDRHHFLNIAAHAMRHIVIDHIRRRQAQKRDGGVQLVSATDIADDMARSSIDLIAMDEALTELERLDSRQAKVVELRFFAGLDLKEIATMLSTSERTIKRDWQKARAFLYAALS